MSCVGERAWIESDTIVIKEGEEASSEAAGFLYVKLM